MWPNNTRIYHESHIGIKKISHEDHSLASRGLAKVGYTKIYHECEGGMKKKIVHEPPLGATRLGEGWL